MYFISIYIYVSYHTYRFRSTCASCAYLHTLSLVILTYALLILQLKTNTKHKYF